jgi:hypothetical protein
MRLSAPKARSARLSRGADPGKVATVKAAIAPPVATRFGRPAWTVVLAVVLAAACGGPSTAEVASARAAVHDREAGAALTAIAETIKANYPSHVAIDLASRSAKTPWHQLTLQGFADEERTAQNSGDPNLIRRYFIRFDVELVPAGTGFRVAVTGHAAELLGQGMPKPMTGPDTPHWLAPRVEKLEVAIWEQLGSGSSPTEP